MISLVSFLEQNVIIIPKEKPLKRNPLEEAIDNMNDPQPEIETIRTTLEKEFKDLSDLGLIGKKTQ